MKREISDYDLKFVKKIAMINKVPVQDCDDIVSDVFYSLINQGNIEKEFENYEGWLFVVTKNAISSYFKQQQKRASLTCCLDEIYLNNEIKNSAITGKDDIIEKMIKDAHLKEEVKVLDEVSREIIEMYYLYGYKLREISEILQLNENTVKTLKTRALNTLRERLLEESRMIT